MNRSFDVLPVKLLIIAASRIKSKTGDDNIGMESKTISLKVQN